MSHTELVSAQHTVIGNVSEGAWAATYQRTTHPDAQWFPRSLGLFIHWGISSVRGTGDLSWSMMLNPPGHRAKTLSHYGPPAVQAQTTPNDYWTQADDFSPDRFDPRQWLRAAKEAGFEYAVLTTKHHDGYTLWPSSAGDFGVRNYLPGKDFVRQFTDACRELGLKVGLYYSPPDWYIEKDRMAFGGTTDTEGRRVPVGPDHQPIDPSKLPSLEEPDFKQRWNARVKTQLHELLSNYGRIDLLWFDGSSKDAVTLEELRELQPGIVFNQRGLGYGDYVTPECAFPPTQPEGWWEYCHIWNDGAWGYLEHETYKPAGWMLGEWAKARSWNGSFLVNVGLNSRGELPDPGWRRMAQVAAWQKRLGHTIAKKLLPARKGMAPSLPVFEDKAADGAKWYVHLLFDWDESEVVIHDVSQKPASVRLLSGRESVANSAACTSVDLAWTMDGGTLRIPIGKSLRGVLTDVVEIRFDTTAGGEIL